MSPGKLPKYNMYARMTRPVFMISEREKDMKYEYLLSICMMVKDEGKNLRRCLEAMKSLIQRSDVELIIVDTGSRDNTVEIAKEYTDKVFFHEWNNHFSEMRNITISYAKGMYLLIIDADEVLTDAGSLYRYISDDKYRSYNAFALMIKNFTSGGMFTVISQERVFKNDGTFRYEGAVHNQPRFKHPVLGTGIYLEHYGYMFQDRELREKKFRRTAGILLKELAKDPDNIYYRFQLAKSYMAHRDKPEAYKEIKKAYELMSDDIAKKQAYIYVYGTYGMLSYECNEFDEAIKVCREGIELQPEYLDLYYIMAAAYIRLNKTEEAISAYKKYTELAGRYTSLSISSSRSVEMFYTGEKCMDTAYAFIYNELYKKRDYEKCYEYASLISDNDIRTVNLAKVLLKLKKYDEVKNVYVSCAGDKTLRETVELLIESESENMTDEEKKELQASFSDGEGPYFMLNRFRCAGGPEREALRVQAIKQIDFGSANEYYADILADFEDDPAPVLSALKKISKSKVKKYINRLYSKSSKFEEFFEQYALDGTVRDDDYNTLKVFIGIAYVILYAKAADAKNSGLGFAERYYNIFKRYVDKGIRYTKILYNPERLRLYYRMIEDQEDIFFIAMQYANEAVERKDFRTAMNYFREAARANTHLACYMNKYKGEFFRGMTDHDSGPDDGGRIEQANDK